MMSNNKHANGNCHLALHRLYEIGESGYRKSELAGLADCFVHMDDADSRKQSATEVR